MFIFVSFKLQGRKCVRTDQNAILYSVSLVLCTRCFRYLQETGSPSHNFSVVTYLSKM